MKKLIWLAVAAVFAGLTSLAEPVHADGVTYSVMPQLPNNQIDRSAGYYDLLVKPGATQTLRMTITNQDTATHRYRVSPNRAVTNANGVIDYSRHGSPASADLAVNIEQLFSAPQTVTIPAGGSQTVRVKLTVPKQRFTGVVLGGLYVTQVAEADAKTKQGVGFTNRFAYATAVQLQMSRKAVAPQLTLTKVQPTSKQQTPPLTATLANIKPTVVHDLSVTAKLTHQGASKPALTASKTQLSMAPNSTLAFALGQPGQRLKAGRYTLTLTAKTDTTTWRFTKRLTLQGTAAAASKPKPTARRSVWWLVLSGALVAVGAVAVGWMRRRSSRRRH